MSNPATRPSKPSDPPKRKNVKGKGSAGIPISNVAGAKAEAVCRQEIEQRRQMAVKQAIIEELRAKKTSGKEGVVVIALQSAPKTVPDRKPKAQHGLTSVNPVTPKPMREIPPAPPSKPDTRGRGGTKKPPAVDPVIRGVKEFLRDHPLPKRNKPRKASQ
jgi:hypothetical protein